MASWRLSSERSYRSTSPNSPPTPLSPHSIPQWLRSGKATSAVLPPGRYKLLLVAFGCMLLGWFVTSTLSPEVRDLNRGSYDNSHTSSGVLNDPTGFGIDIPLNKTHIEQAKTTGNPTIKGALGDLHKAVSDKINGWQGHKSEHTSTPNSTKTFGYPAGERIHDALNEDERLGARTRIGKCTILFNGNDLWERAIKTHEAHDKIHGYRLHVLRQHILDDVWSKPAYILSLVLRELAKPESERLEWLLWVDADTILLNPYIPIEAFLPPPGQEFAHIHMLYSNDWNGLNNGVFPIRVSKWAAELLGAIVSFRYFRPDEQLTFRDQSAMDIIMKEPQFAKNVMRLPQRWFNAYQGEHNQTLEPHMIRRGDLLVHFAGVGDRDNRMAFWLDRAEQHLEDWEVPYKSTSYPQEIRDFWAEKRAEIEGHNTELTKARLAATEMVNKVEKMMAVYSDRLTAEKIEGINKDMTDLKTVLADEHKSQNLTSMSALTNTLQASAANLETVKAESHKLTLTSAHEAIFGGEKDLLDAGFFNGVTNSEAIGLDAAVKRVKELILTSEDQWDRQQIMASVEAITRARAQLKEKTLSLEAEAARKAQEDAKLKAQEDARLKAQEDAKLKAQEEARVRLEQKTEDEAGVGTDEEDKS